MGKGSSAPAESTVTQTNLPEYAQPYFTELLERTSEQSTTPYTPYEGPRLAETAPETYGSYDLTRQIAGQGIAGLPQAMGAISGALGTSQALGYASQPYQFSMANVNYGLPGAQPAGPTPQPGVSTGLMPGPGPMGEEPKMDLSGFSGTRGGRGPGAAGVMPQRGEPQATGPAPTAGGMPVSNQAQVSQFGYDPTQTFTAQNVGQYMSPYMQNVLDVQKQQALRDFNEQRAGRDARAVAAGAFGGSRQGVQEGIAERSLLDRMANIQAAGQQQAFQNAQQAFQADRAADFARQQAQAQEQARVQGIGVGELGRVQGAQAAENRAAGQFALGAFGQTAGLAGQLAALGETGRAADIQNAQLLEAIGQAQEGTRQQQLDLAYQDFLRQQAYPEQQLQLYSSILRGVPVSPSTESTLYQPYNPMQQALGAGLGAIGLYRGMSA